MDIAGLDTYDLCAMFIEPRLNADAPDMRIKSTYEKIQDLIRKELGLPELSEVKPLCDIVLFIAFRIMLYCDASHDFSSQLPEDYLRELKNELIEDIKWYRETYCHIKLLASVDPLPPQYHPPSNVLKSGFSTHVRKEEEIVSLIVSCLNPSYDDYLPYLVKNLMDYEKSINPRATKPTIDYIPNDSIAKTISSIILNHIFLINQESIGETKDEVCTYASSGYSLIVKYIYNNVYGKTVGQNIDLTIDQESSPKNTHELLSEIRADRKQSLCNIDKDNMMENAITDLISSNYKPHHKIRLLQTIATFMDPGSNSFLQNRKYLSEKDEIIQSKASQLDKWYTLNFNGIQIIKYIYTIPPGETNYSVQFAQIFRNEGLTPPLKSLDTSIRNIVSSIVKMKTLPTYCSFYKTFGDFNQIVEFALYEKYIEQIYEGTKSPTFPLFMTGDLSCSIISSLFTQNTILEASSQDLFGGLQIYVTENEKLNYDYFLREIKPGINTQYEIDALKILLDMGGQLSKEVLEEVQSKAQSLTTTEYQSDKHLAAAQGLLTLQSSGFGKYNKKLKLTKTKKIKSKKTKSPVLDEKIQKDIKVMGLSKYFKSSKLSINKIKEKINKLKTLAKKFSLKLDKSVIQNLKKIKELHKQAKKFKINITKKNNKGKRVYKTINQLNTEIKKLKTKNKTKQKK